MCSRNYQRKRKKRNYRIPGGGGGGGRKCAKFVTRITRKVFEILNFVFGNLSFFFRSPYSTVCSHMEPSAKLGLPNWTFGRKLVANLTTAAHDLVAKNIFWSQMATRRPDFSSPAGAKSESNEPRTKLEANSEEKVEPNRSRPITDRNERMTNNAGTNSELNARVTQVSNSNGSTDTMAVMTRVMEMVQQQIAQQTAQSAVQQQLTELLISQQRASQERHYEMIQWQQQTQKDMIEALRVTKQEPQNIGTRETDVARLSKVEMPTFDGKLTEWPHFWESFSINVDSRRSLNGKQKLDLLHRLLKGAAFDKIKGLGLQGENYELAKGILKRHYEDPVKQKEMLWSKLRNLPMVKDNLHNLEKYIDELRATTLSLKRNGVAGEVLDAFVLEVR